MWSGIVFRSFAAFLQFFNTIRKVHYEHKASSVFKWFYKSSVCLNCKTFNCKNVWTSCVIFLFLQYAYNGRAADVWSLGTTLYALVFGNVPFLATSVPGVYEKIKNEELVFPETPEISDSLRNLIENLLHKDPSQRLTMPQIKVTI